MPRDEPQPRFLHPWPVAMTMNGVMMPWVSAGSNHVGASEM